MHRTLRTLRVLAAAAALALAGTASIATAADAGEDSSMAGAPAVRDCYDLTLKQVGGYDTPSETVPCRSHHTAVVSAVGKLPGSVEWSDTDAVADAVDRQCDPSYFRLLGSSNLLWYYRSAYSTWWLAPDEADRDGGARWFSCLVAVTEDTRLAALPTRLPRLTAQLPNVVAKCVTRTYHTTTCAARHAYRSTWAFYVRGTATDASVKRAADRVCPRHVATSKTWLRSSWDIDGPRFIVGCYTKTTR